MFKKKCQHEYELVGYFYKEYLTEYKNVFDEVNDYKRLKRKKCGEISDVLLSSENLSRNYTKAERNAEKITYKN